MRNLIRAIFGILYLVGAALILIQWDHVDQEFLIFGYKGLIPVCILLLFSGCYHLARAIVNEESEYFEDIELDWEQDLTIYDHGSNRPRSDWVSSELKDLPAKPHSRHR